ncbi:MAG: electron transport complex subunit RsxA [Spirochaetes bacterium RBG_13_51_14]|nr:MAG: electron transport complex subunit RsxA [Spirochaetes bacterium RBG_13_51_14]
MEIKVIVTILLGSIFINNYVLARMLGVCPFLGVLQKLDSAAVLGLAVVFFMTLTSFITYPIYKYVLAPNNISYLTTIAFIIVIGSLAQFMEMIIRKYCPPLFQALEIFPPLIVTNCAVLGAAVINISSGFAGPDVTLGMIKSVAQGFGGGVGFTLALIIMVGIRERLELADIPENLKGAPVTFLTAGLLALAFFGFSGLKI